MNNVEKKTGKLRNNFVEIIFHVGCRTFILLCKQIFFCNQNQQ